MKSIWWFKDYEAIRERVGSIELPDWSCIELRGSDRASLLNSLATNQLDDTFPGDGRETFLADAKGHVVAHGMVLVDEDVTRFVTAAPRAGTIVEHLQRYVVREHVQIADRSVQTALWYCGGRGAERLLEDVGMAVPQEPGQHAQANWAGAPLKACRVDMAGPIGFLLMTHREHARLVAALLQQAEVKTCIRQAFDSARIQWGWPLDRIDISGENFPQEVGRDEQSISSNKGCYLGQETIARIESLGHVNKRLVLVRFPDAQDAASVDLFIQGKRVGSTTSTGYSPEFSCPVALAYVRSEWSTLGTILDSPLGQAETIPLQRLSSVS